MQVVAGRDLDHVMIHTTEFDNSAYSYVHNQPCLHARAKRRLKPIKGSKRLSVSYRPVNFNRYARQHAPTTLLTRLCFEEWMEANQLQNLVNLNKSYDSSPAECITRLATVGHPPKQDFIHRSIRNDLSEISFPIRDSIELQTACSCAIEAARIKDVTKEDLDQWFGEFEKKIKEKKYSE